MGVSTRTAEIKRVRWIKKQRVGRRRMTEILPKEEKTLKVNILMSTYNGEKFVAEQIDSIQKQTFSDWQLLVRDDGSQDKTCQIVEKLAQSDKRIRLIKAENVGVIQSFYELVKMERADFYFFCDQDDFWLPSKLEILLDEASKHNNDKPIMYYSDLKIVDKHLTVLSDSMIKMQSDHANTQLVQELTENTVTGCTMLINHALAEKWTDTNHVIMHDWYLALIAAALGKLVYVNQPTVLYRQHDDNVLGARTLSKRMKNWFGHWFKKYWWLIESSQIQAKKLLDFPELTVEKRQLIIAYVNILNQSASQRRATLNKYQLRKNKNFHTRIFRTLVITKFAHKNKDIL